MVLGQMGKDAGEPLRRRAQDRILHAGRRPSQPSAEQFDDITGELWILVQGIEERFSRDAHEFGRSHGGGARRPHAAIEHADLAKDGARDLHVQRHLDAGGRDGPNPDPPGRDDIQGVGWVAKIEEEFALLQRPAQRAAFQLLHCLGGDVPEDLQTLQAQGLRLGGLLGHAALLNGPRTSGPPPE